MQVGITAIRDAVLALESEQQDVWRGLREQLAGEGISLVGDETLDDRETRWLSDYFVSHIVPVITPQAIDPAHPFPFVASQGMGMLFALVRIADGARVMEMVLIPIALPRFIRVSGDAALYIGMENLLCRHAELLFPGFIVEGSGVREPSR